MSWYVHTNGGTVGPLEEDVLAGWAREGRLRADDLVWEDGMDAWVPAGRLGRFAFAAATVPLSPPTPLGDDPVMRAILPVGRSGWAIAAGYLGLFSLVFLPAPIAILVSIAAMIDLRRRPEKHGWGRAIFGLVMGVLGTLVLAFLVVSTRRYG